MAHPQVTARECWELACADCPTWWDGMDFAPHFTSAAEAEREAVEVFEFSRDDQGVLRCPDCTKRAKCATAGIHAWTDWRTGGQSAQIRWCEVCNDTETRRLVRTVELPEVPF